jgi:allophanate hydrolase
MPLPNTLLIASLLDGYRARHFSPVDVVERVLADIARAPDRRVWITILPRERVLEYAAALAARDPESLPLYGVPFAIKDNIDLEGVPTTAGCPDYAYIPSRSAFVVAKLIEAGAIPVGKTNLDQFATGLVGTRSPYGAAGNSFDPRYISGGSSSGSAVAVAMGLVSFSLGTDTAGSGRVPAAFNNIVGLKATCGALSTRGVVPACRSLDCVSIFALTAGDAARVYDVAAVFDPEDSYARVMDVRATGARVMDAGGVLAPGPLSPDALALDAAGAPGERVMGAAGPLAEDAAVAGASFADSAAAEASPARAADKVVPAAGGSMFSMGPAGCAFRFGVPRASQLEFFGDAEYARLFSESVARLKSLGGQRVEIDFEPFLATARLLYEGPWVAERYCAVGDFLERQPNSLHPVTRQIISGGRNATAADAFRAQYRLMELRRAAERAWTSMDVLVTPTAGTIYRIDAVESEPIRLNSNLGYYTNFVNLLDLAAVAVPAGFRGDGLPFGVTLAGRAGTDARLLALADRLHRAADVSLGALSIAIPPSGAAVRANFGHASPTALYGAGTSSVSHTASPSSTPGGAATPGTPAVPSTPQDRISVAVCGAHMEGLPLNQQLTSRNATLVSRTRTAPKYKFYALPGGPPHRPGLVRVASEGACIEVEVWSVPASHFGSFVAGIPTPLGIGRVELESGAQVPGFLCESYATAAATDITALGGWRGYLASGRIS